MHIIISLPCLRAHFSASKSIHVMACSSLLSVSRSLFIFPDWSCILHKQYLSIPLFPGPWQSPLPCCLSLMTPNASFRNGSQGVCLSWDWPISLSIMSLRFVYVITCQKFLPREGWKNTPVCACVCVWACAYIYTNTYINIYTYSYLCTHLHICNIVLVHSYLVTATFWLLWIILLPT